MPPEPIPPRDDLKKQLHFLLDGTNKPMPQRRRLALLLNEILTNYDKAIQHGSSHSIAALVAITDAMQTLVDENTELSRTNQQLKIGESKHRIRAETAEKAKSETFRGWIESIDDNQRELDQVTAAAEHEIASRDQVIKSLQGKLKDEMETSEDLRSEKDVLLEMLKRRRPGIAVPGAGRDARTVCPDVQGAQSAGDRGRKVEEAPTTLQGERVSETMTVATKNAEAEHRAFQLRTGLDKD